MAAFLMPSLGADMETGRLVQWLVRPGERVRRGDIVAVVETHKGAIDVEIFLEGVIRDLAPLGQDLPVGAVLAQVEAAGAGTASVPAAGSPVTVVAAAGRPAAGSPVEVGSPVLSAFAPMPVRQEPAVQEGVPPRAAAVAFGVERLLVSPAARRRAGALGVALDGTLKGSGVGGAVVLADVERAAAALSSKPAVPVPAATMLPARAGGAPRRGFDVAEMRSAIAAAMGRSKREIPHYYLGNTVDFQAANRWLEAYNRERDPEQRLLPAALLLKATALALRELPAFNGFYEGGAFRPGPGIHVGWAIALRGGGLVAPAIHDADGQTLSELMAALRDLVQRARAGGLRSSELTDPTVTVTSLGERGAEAVWGVIYPPQVAILGFGRVVERPWVADGQIVARPLVHASLAADHRVSDGHQGGQLLAAIDRALQTPENL